MNTPPRFYVREHAGYILSPTGQTSSHATMRTELMVIDRDYSHRVVASVIPRGGRTRSTQAATELQRGIIAALCDEMNLEAAREPVSC